MRCPFCSDQGNRVADTRLVRDGEEIRRRRECAECGRRFTTRERVEVVLPKIIKRDERREEYQREKLLRGIDRACVKRPVSAEAVERLMDRIERRLQESGEREVTSRYVGERVLAMRGSIERGETLTRAAAACGLFNPLMLQMMAVGEETGTVAEMFREIAESYESEVDYELKRLSDTIEPVMIVFIGAIVLILALGVYLPMWDMAAAARW